MRLLCRTLAGLAAGLALLVAPGAEASLLVSDTVTPFGAGSHHALTVTNTGPADVVLVSILDAPIADALIDASLTAPDGFLALYDGGLGVIDLVEAAALFAVGTSAGSFTFDSGAPLGAPFFTSFRAFTVAGDLLAGTVATRVPGPDGLVAAALGALMLGAARLGLVRARARVNQARTSRRDRPCA
jgi:hypothetical protein